MLGLIQAFFAAITAFLNYKTEEVQYSAKTVWYNLDKQIEQDTYDTEAKITALRATGTDASNALADRMLQRLVARTTAVIPAGSSSTQSGSSSTNK